MLDVIFTAEVFDIWDHNSDNIMAKTGGLINVWSKRKLSKKVSNDQEIIQSGPTSCPQNQKGNN